MKYVIVVLVLLGMVVTAGAGMIWSTFGPSDSYHPYAAAVVGRADGTDLQQGVPFVVPSSASYFLDSVEAAVSALSANHATITFDLMTDSEGLPGTVLETFAISGITTEFTGEIVLGVSTLRPTLLAGHTYWLTASTLQSECYWNLVDRGAGTPRATRWNLGTWQVDAGEDASMAYRISGTVVPEPLALSFLFVGTVVLALQRDRHPNRI